MADPVDRADQEIDALHQSGMIKVSKALAPETHPDFEAPYCLDCAEIIPDARLAWGRIRCVFCQTKLEKAKT